MKKPERLIGYIKYNDIEFPFPGIWEAYSSPMKLFDSFKQGEKTHKWIPQSELSGTTSEGHHIIFNVQDVPSNYHGFISFKVNWYMCHSTTMQKDRISGFRILGQDVNLFYPPQIALESKIEFKEDGRSIEKITVNSKKQQIGTCGSYRINKKIDADIYVTAYASFHSDTWINPIDSISGMIITLSIPVGINTIIKAYYNLRHFFEYVTYRKNVEVEDLDIFFKNEEGLHDYSGIVVFPNEHKKESHEKVKDRIIPYHILKDHASKLFVAIDNNDLGFQHLCDSIDDMRRYPASRIIMIFAAFEREYRNVYGQDSGRSGSYLEVKEDVVILINKYMTSKQGKKRQYAKQLKKYVEDRDSSFETNIKNALNDCEEIMTPFVSRKYPGSYQDTVHEISKRMGEVRNGIAHSRLDLNFDAIHLSDIRVIEELLYAIRLKDNAMNVSDCQKAINQLFGENFAF